MEKILLETQQEYDLVKSRGYEPLLPNKYFRLDIKLRKQIQSRLFGHSEKGRGNDIMAANDRFFHWVFDRKNKGYCEECVRPIKCYSAVHCSHILSRGAYPEMAIDPRNINILCFDCHNKWENPITRKRMRIYESNLLIIKELKSDYGKGNLEYENNCNEKRY